MTRRNPELAACLDALEAGGADAISAEVGGKHIKVRAVYRGRPLTISVPTTSSDHRCAKNVRTKTRRLLRQIEEAASA